MFICSDTNQLYLCSWGRAEGEFDFGFVWGFVMGSVVFFSSAVCVVQHRAFSVKGKLSRRRKLAENVTYFNLHVSFGCDVTVCTEKVFSFYLNSLGCSSVGLLFADEEQKKIGLWQVCFFVSEEQKKIGLWQVCFFASEEQEKIGLRQVCYVNCSVCSLVTVVHCVHCNVLYGF